MGHANEYKNDSDILYTPLRLQEYTRSLGMHSTYEFNGESVVYASLHTGERKHASDVDSQAFLSCVISPFTWIRYRRYKDRLNKVFVFPPAFSFFCVFFPLIAPGQTAPKHKNAGMCPSQGAYQHSASHRTGSHALTTGYCLTRLCSYVGTVHFYKKAQLSLVSLFIVMSWSERGSGAYRALK